MADPHNDTPELVPLGEAERLCGERLSMSPAQFRHQLAEHVRSRGGIPWLADVDAVGVRRDALEAFLHQAAPPPQEFSQ